MKTSQQRNEEKIASLHPELRPKAEQLITQCSKIGIQLLITEGFRSFERQQELYDQPTDGKDNDGDGQVDEADEKVTNAKPGQGFHNYALALDVVPVVNGKPNWNVSKGTWEAIGKTGEALGLEWGGRWRSPIDKPHFQYPRGHSYKYLLDLKNSGKVDEEGYVILT